MSVRTALLLATTTTWVGVGRMPRALARAGFRVALLTPRGGLAEHSRYVQRIGYLPDEATMRQWVGALLQAIEATAPDLLVPGDEMACRLLIILALEPPPGLDPAVADRLRRLVVESIGRPGHMLESIDKTQLPEAAEKLGVRVPRYEVVFGVDAAIAAAARLGFPAVLKRRFGFGGGGVAVVHSVGEARVAATRLLEPDQLDLGGTQEPRLLVQKFIRGPYHSQALSALEGEPLRNFAWTRHTATDAEVGQTSVLRFIDSPETQRFSELLCRGFGMSGFLNVQFMVDGETGEAHLLEINRRWITHTHLGERLGRDICVALAVAMGVPQMAPADEPVARIGDTVAVFPREWLRDPAGRGVRDHPVDIPWDEPELIAALLAQRREES